MPAHSMWRRSALWFAIALLVQLAVLGGIVAGQQVTTQRGKAVYFKIEPLDPRDPLRGDYMTFRYSVSHIPYDEIGDPMKGLDPSDPAQRAKLAATTDAGATIWVPLSPGENGLWRSQYGSQVVPNRPTTGDATAYESGQLFIRGSVESTDSTGVNVVYGIEEYFIPEGTGADWPRAGVPDAKARVLIDPKTGKAQLNQVFLDGRAWP